MGKSFEDLKTCFINNDDFRNILKKHTHLTFDQRLVLNTNPKDM